MRQNYGLYGDLLISQEGIWSMELFSRQVSPFFLQATQSLRESRGIALLCFQTSALGGGEGPASHPGRFLLPGKTWYSLYRRLGGPQARSGQLRKISPHRDSILGPSSPQPVTKPTELPGPGYLVSSHLMVFACTLVICLHERSHSLEIKGCLRNQNIPSYIWNAHVHYAFDNILKLTKQMDPFLIVRSFSYINYQNYYQSQEF